jgi:hypothetical protein
MKEIAGVIQRHNDHDQPTDNIDRMYAFLHPLNLDFDSD